MSVTLRNVVVGLPFCLLLATDITACEVLPPMELNIHTVFDEQDPELTWFHRLANWLHIETRAETLENELAFLSPCETDPKRLYEAERYLRSRNYLRDAKVQVAEADDQRRIQIDTWDTWSLMPILDFGRTGGKNHFELGIKDRNLLGRGIDAELSYFSDPQRSGYKIDTEFPLHRFDNTDARIRLIDSPDGYQRSLSLNRPFISLHDNWSGQLAFNREDRIDTVFQNANDEYLFRHQIDYLQLQGGWKWYQDSHQTLRLLGGFRNEEHQFFAPQADYLPQDRRFTAPWLGLEYLQDEFVTLHNLHLIEQNEDINLGWHVRTSLGWNLVNGPLQDSLLWSVEVNKGLVINDSTLLLSTLKAEGFTDGKGQEGSLSGLLSSEMIHRLSASWAWYLSATWQFSDNPLLDNPLSLGGETGLRGFPLQYQHGEHSLVMNTELRHYPKINLFKLFELGGAIFYDAGKVYGDSLTDNQDSGVLQNIGIGARLYSAHSSDRQVIHIDLVHPFSDLDEVSNLEFRIEVKHAF
ncbi:ShlB/FhaC/HecB family hemolysin secretion/activation protein [Bowmanella dokdonensis]|uniref:Haemolysin activator HlyB C-terminal domain-containing protein n=1 Tax=Bowmanella dokdonensis TaxID=751969 RepID=A0A939DQ08_9ALTE|nr:ShlB/FhaC/HecB family hemolysin secretion/activation protein [Bowmanella dokdonensis]MBN7826848.1 hypothetical protein [Bowmanella dokdonensis]